MRAFDHALAVAGMNLVDDVLCGIACRKRYMLAVGETKKKSSAA